jgi:hypothetical protein
MNEQSTPSIAELFADDALVTAAIQRGAREAVSKHAQAGQPVAIWQDGKVVWIPAEEVLARLSAKQST